MIEGCTTVEAPFFSLSRDATSYVGSERADTYAKQIVRNLERMCNEKIPQSANFTFGQVVVTMPSEFGFRVGTPSIRLVWNEDGELDQWASRIQRLCDCGSEDAALKEIALTTSRLKVNKKLARLSESLALFDLKRLPDVILVSLLRNTFSIRSHIPFWNALLDQTEQILHDRKREPHRLLRGLKR